MEDILEVYSWEYDSNKPVLCVDETSKQQIKETRIPIAMKKGMKERFDYEYERNGVSNIFMCFEPLAGKRYVKVTEHRKKVDWARLMKELVDVRYPDAERIVVVMDNLNTHTKGALYEAFQPEEALRILNRLEFHFTPKHGSWLNMAETELSILSRQCLNRRIPDQHRLKSETQAWEKSRNEKCLKVDWQFRAEDARIKLKKLYPSIQE